MIAQTSHVSSSTQVLTAGGTYTHGIHTISSVLGADFTYRHHRHHHPNWVCSRRAAQPTGCYGSLFTASYHHLLLLPCSFSGNFSCDFTMHFLIIIVIRLQPCAPWLPPQIPSRPSGPFIPIGR